MQKYISDFLHDKEMLIANGRKLSAQIKYVQLQKENPGSPDSCNYKIEKFWTEIPIVDGD